MILSNSVAEMDEKQLKNEGEQSSTATLSDRSSTQYQKIANNSNSLNDLFQISALYRAEKDLLDQNSIEIDPIIRPH